MTERVGNFIIRRNERQLAILTFLSLLCMPGPGCATVVVGCAAD